VSRKKTDQATSAAASRGKGKGSNGDSGTPAAQNDKTAKQTTKQTKKSAQVIERVQIRGRNQKRKHAAQEDGIDMDYKEDLAIDGDDYVAEEEEKWLGKRARKTRGISGSREGPPKAKAKSAPVHRSKKERQAAKAANEEEGGKTRDRKKERKQAKGKGKGKGKGGGKGRKGPKKRKSAGGKKMDRGR